MKPRQILLAGTLVVGVLSVLLVSCGRRDRPGDVINAWADAATEQDWSQARELMQADEGTFVAWRNQQQSISPDLQPPHQVLGLETRGDTTSAIVRWPANTGGWCIGVDVDAQGKLAVPRPAYACDPQAQPIDPPAPGEVQARAIQQATDVYANAIEIDPIASLQLGERVVVVMESYNRNRYWYKVRPAPGSTVTWSEGWIFAQAAGGR